MWSDLLCCVLEKITESGFKCQLPCPESRIETLTKRVRRDFGVELPVEYKELLKRTDGLNWNGLFIYASRTSKLRASPNCMITGIVEDNSFGRDLHDRLGFPDDYSDPLKDYFVFGDDDLEMYAYHIPTKKFQVFTKPGMIMLERYRSCGSLFSAALKRCLQ
jgi:hypothetical protein